MKKKNRANFKEKNDSEAQTHRSYNDFKNIEVQTKTWEEIIKEY